MTNDDDSEMRAHYDFSSGVRNKYAGRLGGERPAFILTGLIDREYVDVELPPSEDVVDWMVIGKIRLDAIITPVRNEFPRLLLTWHSPHGFSAMVHLNSESVGDFACRSLEFTAPAVTVRFTRIAAELWPEQLFVDRAVAKQVLDYFRNERGKNPAIPWIDAAGFPRVNLSNEEPA